jgi:uncharacterized membrane-anchored protein
MSKKTIWSLLILAVVATALILGLPQFSNLGSNDIAKQENTVQPEVVTVTVEGLYSSRQITLKTNQTVLQVLQMLDSDDPQLRLATKEYSGLGTLVESMNGQTNGTNGEYWQYKVNGVMPQVGADKYNLKNGDTMEWNFDKPSEDNI